MLLQVSFDIPELFYKIVVLEDLDVLHMEICLRVSLELLFRLTRVNSFQDAHASEILKAELETTNRITPCQVLGRLALFASFYLSSHFF